MCVGTRNHKKYKNVKNFIFMKAKRDVLNYTNVLMILENPFKWTKCLGMLISLTGNFILFIFGITYSIKIKLKCSPNHFNTIKNDFYFVYKCKNFVKNKFTELSTNSFPLIPTHWFSFPQTVGEISRNLVDLH